MASKNGVLDRFAVVEFPTELTVEIVSTKWLSSDNQSCYWPNAFKSKLQNLILTHADPLGSANSKLVWSCYSTRVLKVYDTYEQARSNIDAAQYTSNLDSADEHQLPRRRRGGGRKTNSVKPTTVNNRRVSSSSGASSDACEDSSLLNHKLQDTPQQQRLFRQLQDSSPQTLGLVTPTGTSQRAAGLTSARESSGCRHEIGTLKPNELISHLETVRPETTSRQSASSSSPRFSDVFFLLQSIQREVQEEKENNQRFQEIVITRLVNLETDLKELLGRTNNQSGTVTLAENLDFDLPVSSLDEFTKLRVWLENEDNFKKLLVRLTILGGKSPRDMLNRLMDELIVKSVASKLSLTGRGKRSYDGFRGTSIFKLLSETVRHTKGGELTTDSEIEDFIKKYLKNASEKPAVRDEPASAH